MRNTLIIFRKQCMDTLRNKTVLVQFILFPAMTLIMENAIRLDGMPEWFFAKLFSVMYVGMAPLTSAAAIISEEKEKNTLRVLTMANVRPMQYLFGVGAYVWIMCMAGAAVMATCLAPGSIPFYLLVMGIGFAISVTAGACIGIFARNQMAATSIVMPVMMLLSFSPMLAYFNARIERGARFIYTQQLSVLLERMATGRVKMESVCTIMVNAGLMVLLFLLAFRKKGLE